MRILSSLRAASASAALLATGAVGAATIASVMPSERMFRHKTVIMIAKPGNNACHQYPKITPALAEDKMLPHVGVGSGIPALMKLREASNTIASATESVVNTITGAAILRVTCLSKIQGARAPETITART
ncbi:Uncharacterised protein [Chlamydia trachomatis]|nr:Uncharacterised protein [Chlamydia trachomatis]